jgi:hypothetical protein
MTIEPLQQAVASASQCHFRLVLLVGPPRSGKTRLLHHVAESQGLTALNLNLLLAERLLELTQKQRPVRVQRLLGGLVEAQVDDPVLLDNIELLFDLDLRLDPLRVLQRLARNRTIVAAWPGALADGALTYAEPGHPEAQRYIDPEATVVLAATLAAKTVPAEAKAMGETEESK